METTKLVEKIENGELDAIDELVENLVSEKKYQEAFEWLQKGANLGHRFSMVKVAQFYAKGISTDQDYALALSWLMKAACLGAQIREYVFEYIGEDNLEELALSGNEIAEYYYSLLLKSHDSSSNLADNLLSDAAEKKMPLALATIAIKEMLSLDAHSILHFLEAIDNGYDYYTMLKDLKSTGLMYHENEKQFRIEDMVRTFVKEWKQKRPFVIVKITKKEYAKTLVDEGKVFIQSLDNFRKSKQAAVGDMNEGIASTGHNQLWQDMQIGEIMDDCAELGVYDEYMAHERLYCLYALEWDEQGNIVKPDIRMKQFGDTAVVIWNTKEFISRLTNKIREKYGDIWVGYGKIQYDVRFDSSSAHTEFSKTEPYAWQNEFRFVIDVANGRFEKDVWDKTEPSKKDNGDDYSPKELEEMSAYERIKVFTKGMTDFAKVLSGKTGDSCELFVDTGNDTLQLGSLADICEVFSITEFIELLPDFIKTVGKSEKECWQDIPEHNRPVAFRPFIKFL